MNIDIRRRQLVFGTSALAAQLCPNFIAAVREQMPDRLVTSTTGTEFAFGA